MRLSDGVRTVPVISIGNEIIIGFDKNRLEQVLKKLS